MHVVCVCVELQAFCIFGLNCLLAGRSDALRAMTFDRHKVVMDITFAAWCEVNIEFAELLFLVKLWMLGFGFDMSERMSKRYVRKHVKRYVRKNVRRYVRQNVKRYVRKMSERISEDMSKDMFRKNVGRYIRRYVRKNVKRYVRKNVRRLLPVSLRS